MSEGWKIILGLGSRDRLLWELMTELDWLQTLWISFEGRNSLFGGGWRIVHPAWIGQLDLPASGSFARRGRPGWCLTIPWGCLSVPSLPYLPRSAAVSFFLSMLLVAGREAAVTSSSSSQRGGGGKAIHHSGREFQATSKQAQWKPGFWSWVFHIQA